MVLDAAAGAAEKADGPGDRIILMSVWSTWIMVRRRR
jgi:hypothetical protein